MIKICGVLKKQEFKDKFKNGTMVLELTVAVQNAGDYPVPPYYVEDPDSRNWKDLQGQYVEIPCSSSPSVSAKGGVYPNYRVLTSVDPKKCVAAPVKAA